jgi:hypothetical protein
MTTDLIPSISLLDFTNYQYIIPFDFDYCFLINEDKWFSNMESSFYKLVCSCSSKIAMDILKFLFHLFILFPVIYTSEDYCQNSWCSENNILIRFPFQLEVDGDPLPYCGYPGFKLSCTNDSKTVLTLPYSGVFYVRIINYLEHHIQVYDPHRCLPNRLLSLNLSGSPFVTEFLTNYTLLSCSTPNMLGSQFTPVDCLSNSTHFVSAIPSLSFTNSLPQSCYIIRNFSVPVAISYPEFFLNNFSEDLELTWSSPDCRYCELQDRTCGFESRNNNQVRCFSNQQTGTY